MTMHPDINYLARPLTVWQRAVWPVLRYIGSVAILAAAIWLLAVGIPTLGGA